MQKTITITVAHTSTTTVIILQYHSKMELLLCFHFAPTNLQPNAFDAALKRFIHLL